MAAAARWAVMVADSWLTPILESYAREHAAGRTPCLPPRFLRLERGARPARRWMRYHLHCSGLAYGLPLPRPGLLSHPEDAADPGLSRRVAVAGHLADLVVHTAELLGTPLAPERVRPTVAAVLAASMGLVVDAHRVLSLPLPLDGPGEATLRTVELTLGSALRARLEAFASVELGLPLHSALTCVEARTVSRLAVRFCVDGEVWDPTVRRVLAVARRERHAVVVALARVHQAAGRVPGLTVSRARRQLAPAGLAKDEAQELARVLAHPPAPGPAGGDLALPRRLADLLLCQVVLSARIDGRDVDAQALAHALGVPSLRAGRMARRSGQLWAAHRAELAHLEQHLEPPPAVAPGSLLGTMLVGRATKALQRNLDALVQEIRETGELTALLAKAAAGHELSAEEWRKVRDQLLDVVRAVPSLAVFALPGGAVLLPLLLKVLPFDLRPSAFRSGSAPPHPSPAASAAPADSSTPPPSRTRETVP